jgi:hypothetical protein
MADYHFVYKDVEGATTQWDDIQRRLGNLPEKPPAFKPPEFVPRVDADEQPKSKEWLDEREADELEELEDDLEDDRFLEQYRCSPSPRLRSSLPADAVVPFVIADLGPIYTVRCGNSCDFVLIWSASRCLIWTRRRPRDSWMQFRLFW